jgi:hypothetical protein
MVMLAKRSCSSLSWTQKSQLQLSSNLDLLQRHCCSQNQNQNKFLQPKTPRNQSKSLTLIISFGWIRHYMHLLLHSLTLNPKSPAEKPPPIAHHKHIDDLLLLLLLLLSSSSSSSSNHSCEFNNNNKKRKILKHQTGTPLSSSSSTKHQISSQNQISISQSNFLLTSPNLHARIITSNLNLIWGASKFRYKFVKFSILSWWVLK